MNFSANARPRSYAPTHTLTEHRTMQRLASLLGGLTVVALLPAGSALLQGCLQCGSSSTFDLDEASGSYMICPGGEHVFEHTDAHSQHIWIEARRGLDDVHVDFGDHRLERVGDTIYGNSTGLWYDEEYDEWVTACAVLDPAPLVVTTKRTIRYELLVEEAECGDE